MAKVFNKIIFSVICFTFFCFLAFKTCVFHSYCVVALPIETALSGSMNIASEYLCGRAGRNIVNANEVQMNIDGVNMGTVSGDYTSAQGKASGINVPFNLDYINQYTTDIEFSSLSAEDQQKFAAALADDPSANNGSWIFKKCTYGYVTLYWLCDQVGNWLGSSLNDIMASFAPDSTVISTNIDTSISTNYPYRDFFKSKYWHSSTDRYGNPLEFFVTISDPVAYYTVPISSGNDTYYQVYICSTIAISSLSCTGYYELLDLNTGETTRYSIGRLGTANSSSFSINGITYYTVPFKIYKGTSNTSYNIYSQSEICTLNKLKANLEDGVSSVTNSELVDSNQDGYTVPDISSGFGAIISDIYEVIDSLRDGLIGVIDDGLTTTIDDSLADAIADAIADALSKGLAITDEMSGGSGGGNGSGSDPNWSVPDWIIPPFLSDLFPDGLFDMFRPIFYIVPDAYSSYSWWILIPTIILFVIFIYFVVSVL